MNFMIPLYALTLFVSAFLLFSVQPMVGKYLLPVMGGGPSVWNTAMLFFQLLLLGGYAYAHFMAHFIKPRHQFIIHLVLFSLAALSLPMILPAGSDPTGSNPLIWQLVTMLSMAAAPFFILSSTAPLLQQWFSRTSHVKAGNPYFLYVASNLGSMIALLAYPVVIEPLLRLYNQSMVWSYGYGVLGALLLICGLSSKFTAKTGAEIHAHDEDEVITWKRRLTWLLLAFVPSSLMLGVTTYITTDVTTVPLLWVVPLALYLMTFTIAFSEKPFFTLPMTRLIQGIVSITLLLAMVVSGVMLVWSVAVIHLIFFFFTALLCHQELAAIKPKAKRLTEFFLIMSLGGALGGVFNSLFAPLLFRLPYEYMIVIALSLVCRYITDPAQKLAPISLASLKKDLGKFDWKIPAIIALAIMAAIFQTGYKMAICGIVISILFLPYIQKRWLFAGLYIFVMLFNPLVSWRSFSNSIDVMRNYYGVIIVSDKDDVRFMTHGVTTHGGQALKPEKRFYPFSYYGTTSPLSDTFKTSYMTSKRPKDIAVIGLGVGSIACYYNKPERHFDYFEIDPNVIAVAKNPQYFTYLSDCGVKYNIIEGDGRLMMTKEPDKKYDMIVVDAFTSDNIPLHIITKEAVAIYKSKLKEDGILIFHISNRFFRLQRELGAIAPLLGKDAMTKMDPGDNSHLKKNENTRIVNHASVYVMMTENQSVRDEVPKIDTRWMDLPPEEGLVPWSDDYANIMRALIVR